MCWRIVRIEGDGSTKLILEDISTECNSSSYTGNWSGGKMVAFGYDSDYQIDFLNYSGGLADSLKSFQTTLSSKLITGKSLNDYLKIDDWCYDTKGAYQRIYTDKKPSLKCTGNKLKKYKDNTDMYVGLLTADEISFAGATTNSANYTHYLMNSYAKNLPQHSFWYTLSLKPANDVIVLDEKGKYDTRNHVMSVDNYSRPAVCLKSNVQISGGNGTISNPYIIAS